jgi:hypothetical protein
MNPIHVDDSYLYAVNYSEIAQYDYGLDYRSTMVKINKSTGEEVWSSNIRGADSGGISDNSFGSYPNNNFKFTDDYMYYEEGGLYQNRPGGGMYGGSNNISRVNLENGDYSVITEKNVHHEIGPGPIDNNLVYAHTPLSDNHGGLVKVDLTDTESYIGNLTMAGNVFFYGQWASKNYTFDEPVSFENITINFSNLDRSGNTVVGVIFNNSSISTVDNPPMDEIESMYQWNRYGLGNWETDYEYGKSNYNEELIGSNLREDGSTNVTHVRVVVFNSPMGPFYKPPKVESINIKGTR